MAGEEQTNQTDIIEQQKQQLDQLREKYNAQVKMFNDFFAKVEKEDPKIAAEFKNTKESIESSKLSLSGLFKLLADTTPGNAIAAIQEGFQKATAEAAKFSVDFAGYMKDAATSTGTFGAALNASIPLVAALGNQKVVAALPEAFLDLQKKLKDVEKQALQTAMSFGNMKGEAAGFDQAKTNVTRFNTALTESMLVSKSSAEEVRETAKAFKTMGQDALVPLTSLTAASNQLGTALTAVNSALLISKATGMDSAKIAGVMDEMMMNLGISTEAAVQSFGLMSDVAKRTGLGFERTSDTIVGLTKDLKFWGTTVEGIAPLFDTFSRSMQGMGQKGLTPELLKTFVNGIQQMGFGTKALLGMQSPVGRAGGALRSGLQMEEALAKGDFGKIAENLTGTLKQFGGQQILTRQQALESPGAERQYMIQRQMLSQLMGINDPATQDKMLGILSDIDKNGMKGGTDANKAIGDLLKSGKSVADETIPILEDANLKVEAAVYTSGDAIYDAIVALPEHLGIDKLFGDLNSILEDSIRLGGIDKKGLEAASNLLSKRLQERETKLQQDLSPKERAQTEKEVGQLHGTQLALGTLSGFNADDAGKKLTPEKIEEFIGKKMEPVTGRIKKLEGFQRLAPKDFTTEMQAELDELYKDQGKIADKFREKMGAAPKTPVDAFKDDIKIQQSAAQQTIEHAQKMGARLVPDQPIEPENIDKQTALYTPPGAGPQEVRNEAMAAAQTSARIQNQESRAPESAGPKEPIKQEVELSVNVKADITDDGKIILSVTDAVIKELKEGNVLVSMNKRTERTEAMA